MQTSAFESMNQQLEQELWLNEISYLHEEICILERYLSEFLYYNKSDELLSKTDQLENQFLLQKDWLVRMKSEMIDLGEYDETAPTNEKRIVPDRSSLFLQMEVNRKINTELKESFLKFLVKWM